MQGLRLKGAQGFVPIKPSIFIFSLYYPAEPATIVATPYPALRDLPKGKRLTWFSGRFAPPQHGYHRFTEFSGHSRSPTNPVHWCDPSSLATPIQGAE